MCADLKGHISKKGSEKIHFFTKKEMFKGIFFPLDKHVPRRGRKELGGKNVWPQYAKKKFL